MKPTNLKKSLLSAAFIGGLSITGCATTKSTEQPANGQSSEPKTASASATASSTSPNASTQTASNAASSSSNSSSSSDKSPPSSVGAIELTNQAIVQLRRRQYENAIRLCRDALRRDEKYTAAMVVMARAYHGLGKTEFAESVCDIAIGIDPNVGECHNLKGFIALKSDDNAAALKHFEKATQVQSSYGPAWLNLGAQYLKATNYTAAISALEKASELMPDRAEVFSNLGSAYRGAGELSKAQQSYLQALKLKPNYPSAYFNMGLLFLDAPQFPGLDKSQQLNEAINNLGRYKDLVKYASKDDPADSYLDEAKKLLTKEKKRIERDQQKAQRDAAKKTEKPADQPKADQ